MRENPYKRLPPIERKQDGSPYRMTPAQRKRASSLIRRECCNCDGGNCLALDDGDTCPCPQMVTFSICCKWFRWSVLPQSGTLEAEIFRGKDLKCCVPSILLSVAVLPEKASCLVVASCVSFVSPQAAKLTRSAAPPLLSLIHI